MTHIPTERQRLMKLRSFGEAIRAARPWFDSIAAIAAQSCACRASFISFIEEDFQTFAAQFGLALSDIRRSDSICAETIESSEPRIIPSIHTSYPDRAPLGFDFYIGLPLIAADNLALGTLCVLDSSPRSISPEHITLLRGLAQQIVSHLEVQSGLAAVERRIASLEDSEQRFRRIADASPVLLWISDEAGHRTLSNKAWSDFTGLSHAESLAECWRETVHPDDREVHQAKWRKCAANRSSFQHEFRLRHASGTYRWVMEQAIPLFSSNGRLDGYVSSCVDLSLRSSEELQYQHNEARFRAVSEAAPLGIVVTDSSGNCIYSNQRFQKISGLTAEESLGSGWLRPIHPDDSEGITEAWLAATNSINPFEYTVRYQRQDTSVAWCSLKAAAINATDTVSGWVLTIEDITDKKRAEAELIAAKQAAEVAMHSKSQFLANMSHEIRTPLTAILGFAEALRAEQSNEATRQHCLDVIIDNGRHLLQIINDILDLSKIDAGALSIAQAPCNIVQLVEEVRLMFAPAMAEKAITFAIDYHWPLPRQITTDPLRLKQVLINLLGNALKFTQRGHITMSMDWNAQEVKATFTVMDSGIGMSEEQVTSLFQPFYQANETITRRYGGTGLGLSISHRLVRALGGAMEVQSTPGIGTSISFSIRAQPIDDSVFLAEMAREHTSPSLSKHDSPPRLSGKVLFADDALDNRRLVELLLQRVGLEVTLVEDGREAIETALSSPFDLILLDIQMPNVDGLSATRRIREAGIRTPIVAVSAGAMTSDVATALDAGCSMHLSKPFEQSSFYSVLQKYLPKHETTLSLQEPSLIPIRSSLADDPEMTSLLHDFINGLTSRLSDIAAARENKDYERLKALAHKLKGSAGMYGFPELSRQAALLESAAKAEDPQGIVTILSNTHLVTSRIREGATTKPPLPTT